MNIGITFNLKQEPGPGLAEDTFEEFDAPETVDALAAALGSGGHEVFKLGWGLGVIDEIQRHAVEFVFNIAEGLSGRNRESLMPALLEFAGVPYSGSDALTLALTLDKAKAKAVVASAGVNTPAFAVIEEGKMRGARPRFPLFVKPLCEGSSKGIRAQSRVANQRELEERLSWLGERYGKIPVLIERFIDGREVTVGVLGNAPPYLLGIMEIESRERKRNPFVYSLEVKRNWQELCQYTAPARMGKKVKERIEKSALAVYEALGCRDIARLDFRVDAAGGVYFLEANPLPGFSPVSGDVVILARKMSWSYEGLVLAVLKHALERCGIR